MTAGEGHNIRQGSTKEKAVCENGERKCEGAVVGTVDFGDERIKGSSKGKRYGKKHERKGAVVEEVTKGVERMGRNRNRVALDSKAAAESKGRTRNIGNNSAKVSAKKKATHERLKMDIISLFQSFMRCLLLRGHPCRILPNVCWKAYNLISFLPCMMRGRRN